MDSIKAVCIIDGKCKGTIEFEEYTVNKKNNIRHTKIKIHIKNLQKNSTHAIHIHESGDTRRGCSSLGSHYNPFNKTHGGHDDKIRHVGDLGNIVANKHGEVNMIINDDLIKLRGKYSVIGRSVVIHEGIDDLGKGGHIDSLTTGHAGKRMGCGVIGFGEKSQLYF